MKLLILLCTIISILLINPNSKTMFFEKIACGNDRTGDSNAGYYDNQ